MRDAVSGRRPRYRENLMKTEEPVESAEESMT
jgi:hypothetical protein